MGDNSIEPNKEDELTSYTEIFEKSCPYFMAIGMSYDQFWFDDCWVAKPYLEAYKIKKEQINEQLWLQGVYIYEAILDVAPILHAFCKKGTKPIPYPKEPYSLYKKKTTEKEQQIEKEKAINFFENWSKAVGKKFKAEK